MDLDDIRDETAALKPKRTRKKSTPKAGKPAEATFVAENSQTQEPLSETTDPLTKESKPIKKKSGRKKKTTEAKTPLAVPESTIEDSPVSISEPVALGQAGVHNVKVEVIRKVPGDTNVLSASSPVDDEPVVTVPVVSGDQAVVEAQVSSPQVTNTQVINNQTASAQVTASQNVVLPFAAIKVRNVVAKVVNLVAEIIPNKVIVQGTIHEQLFFVGTDGIVHHLGDDIPFSTFLDIPGVQPGMNAQITAIIEEIITEVAANGLSILKKIIIEVFVKITETVQVNLELGTGPSVLLQQVVGENTAQKLIETDVTLFTPALKIDEITGAVQNVTVEIIHDKVIIQGILHKQIFFVDTANLGRHQAEDVPFSLFVDIPGVVPGMDAEIQPRIEAIFFSLVGPATVRQKAILEFFVKVTENTVQQVTIGTGPLFKVEEFVGENTVQELVENVISLSVPAIKVREIVAKLQDFTTHVINDKVIVQGTIHKQIFFIGTDNIEHHQAEDIPFSLFLDIPGAVPGDNVHLNPRIEAIFFELISATALRQKVIFAIHALVTREIQLNLVLGAGPLFKLEQVVGENTKQVLVVTREVIPSPVSPVTIETVTVVFPAAAVIGQQQIIIRNVVQLPVKAIKVKDIQATVGNITSNVITDGVIVQGTVNKTVNFVGTDNIVRSVTENVPFSILVGIPGITPGQVSDVTVTLEDISFSLSPDGMSVIQNIVLLATVQGTTPSPQPSVTIISDVSGPGIVESKLLVEGLVLTPGGAVFQQFEVVTDVSGPGIAGVTKQTVVLQVVGEPAPRPVTVVTDVQLA